MATAIAHDDAPAAAVEGPRYRSVFGWLSEFKTDSLGFLERARDAGDVVVFRAPPVTGFVLSHPDWVRHVLERQRERYWKGRVFGRIAQQAGRGILFSEGERWRQGRRLVQPAFTRERLEAMVGDMRDGVADLVARWETAERRAPGEPVELLRESSMLTFDIAGRALFGKRYGGDLGRYNDLMIQLLEYTNYLINAAFPPPWWLPTPRNVRFWPLRRTLRREVDALVAERRDSGERRDDFLQRLLDAEADPADGYATPRQVSDECITFLGAGHETTGVALAWTGYLLARHPEARERLEAEVDAAVSDTVPTLEELERLPFARRVIQESLRLYPPAWAFGREAHGGDELGGQPVPEGAPIFVSSWTMHRDPRFWPAPERFDPDRFLPERSAGRPRYAYFPFGGGARRCIGDAFALQELAIALGALAKRFRIEAVPGHAVVPHPLFTLRPSPGVFVTRRVRAV